MIAARDPEARIVVVTGVTTPEKVQEALERGARFSFTKPLHFSALGQVVESLLAERRETSRPKGKGSGKRLAASNR
jgi:DNA-binding NarL/FixJ family response regulator